jgi:hypothetical protein
VTEKKTITVKTSGDFMLQDPTTGDEIQSYGTSTVEHSNWIDEQLEKGTLMKSGQTEAKKPEAKDDEPVRAKAETGEKRGASVSKNPDNINRVKT